MIITRYYISVPGIESMKLGQRSLSASNRSSTIRLEIFMIFLTKLDGGCHTNRDNICRNISVIMCNLEHEKQFFFNGAIRWQISKHVKAVSCSFVIDLIINEIVTIAIFEKADQGH